MQRGTIPSTVKAFGIGIVGLFAMNEGEIERSQYRREFQRNSQSNETAKCLFSRLPPFFSRMV